MFNKLKEWWMKDRTTVRFWYPVDEVYYQKHIKNLLEYAEKYCERNKEDIPGYESILSEVEKEDDENIWEAHACAYRYPFGDFGSGLNASVDIKGKRNAYVVARFLGLYIDKRVSSRYGVQWKLIKAN